MFAFMASVGLLVSMPGGGLPFGLCGPYPAEGGASPRGQRQPTFLPGLVEETLHVVTHVSATRCKEDVSRTPFRDPIDCLREYACTCKKHLEQGRVHAQSHPCYTLHVDSCP